MNRLFRSAFNYFIRGLLFVAPLGLTLYILFSAFNFVDSLVRIRFGDKEGFFIPGLGFLIVLVSTILVGFVFGRLIPQTLQNVLEKGIKGLPLVRVFYFAFKDLVSAFLGDKRKFTKPVLFRVNKQSELRKMGFMTQDSLEIIGKEDFVSVYCPHSYAFSGEMFIVPVKDVEQIDLGGAEAMKMIVSGGVSFNE